MDNEYMPDGHESILSKKLKVEAEIRSTKQGDKSVDELYDVMVGLWDQMSKLEPFSLKNVRELTNYKKFQEQNRLVQFLLALGDEFEPIRKQLLGRYFDPSLEEAVNLLKTEETKLRSSSRLSNKGKLRTGSSAFVPQLRPKFGDVARRRPPDRDEGFNALSPPIAMRGRDAATEAKAGYMLGLKSRGSEPGKLVTIDKDDDNDKALSKFSSLSMKAKEDQESDHFTASECSHSAGEESGTMRILSYNVCFWELDQDKRMDALGSLILLHSPHVICFQEVTSDIYTIFTQSKWWNDYKCSVSIQDTQGRSYFCIQLSRLPVKSFSNMPFRNSRMRRELCIADIEVLGKKTSNSLIIATSHLESPTPKPPTYDQMNSEERVVQAKEAVNHLQRYPNVIFCGDMNWDEVTDGRFPLVEGWFDAWTELRPRENGWTYDTKSNQMLVANRPLQKRLDRFICKMDGFRVGDIKMIGTEAIPGLKYWKEKRVRNRMQELELPVLASDHYGLLLEIHSK